MGTTGRELCRILSAPRRDLCADRNVAVRRGPPRFAAASQRDHHAPATVHDLMRAHELQERTFQFGRVDGSVIGVLTLQVANRAGVDRSAEAEASMRAALVRAQSRKLASLSLRAATSLADLWLAQGRHQQAIDVLEPACRAIQGGSGTRDLVNARARLAALRRATVH